jgi:hypothetical protein
MLRHAFAYVVASDRDRPPLPERFEETYKKSLPEVSLTVSSPPERPKPLGSTWMRNRRMNGVERMRIYVELRAWQARLLRQRR